MKCLSFSEGASGAAGFCCGRTERNIGLKWEASKFKGQDTLIRLTLMSNLKYPEPLKGDKSVGIELSGLRPLRWEDPAKCGWY